MSRITREEFFTMVIRGAELRSTCNRKHVGAILVRNGRIVATSYAGSPPGQPHCEDEGCIIGPDGGCIRTQHAEANLIAFCAKYGIPTDGAELWCSLTPCLPCAKLIAASGIKHYTALEEYRLTDGQMYLIQAGIQVGIFHATKS